MSNLGKYQEHIIEMYNAGGPDKWEEEFAEKFRQLGHSDMIPAILLTAAGIAVITWFAKPVIINCKNWLEEELILLETEWEQRIAELRQKNKERELVHPEEQAIADKTVEPNSNDHEQSAGFLDASN